jgi:hypothetical protein
MPNLICPRTAARRGPLFLTSFGLPRLADAVTQVEGFPRSDVRQWNTFPSIVGKHNKQEGSSGRHALRAHNIELIAIGKEDAERHKRLPS